MTKSPAASEQIRGSQNQNGETGDGFSRT